MLKLAVVALVATTTFAGDGAAAAARASYNGRWSVVIITEQGTCDRGYRYAIDISNGVMHYDGDVVDINGRVAGNGAVRVTISRGSQQANGQGRLDRNSGQGIWSTKAGSGSCSGRWEAERR